MRLHRACACFSLLILMAPACARAGSGRPPHPAASYRTQGEPVVPSPGGFLLCEAEEFTVEGPGWPARPWGENACAATFANTFLSRKAFLGAPPSGATTRASLGIAPREAARYLVLARYEAG